MLRQHDLMGNLIDKVQIAIDRLKAFEPPDGYYLAFSGGKDSCCIKELAIMAGVKFDAHYSVTTVDPPELVRFIKYQHPDVIFERPKLSMMKLIEKKMFLPMKNARYCCSELKETGGEGRVVVTGVRWAESQRRRRIHGVARVDGVKKEKSTILNDDNDESRRMVEQCYRTRKTMVNPIVDWLDEDVWEFIHERSIPYCSLYDEGYKRLGCVGCPMLNKQSAERDFARWPQYEKLYKNAIQKIIDKRNADGKPFNNGMDNVEKVWQWWLSRKAGVSKNQISMEDDE